MDKDAENQMIEIQLLLDAVYLKYGYDFRSYAEASLKRRILRNLAFSGYRNILELLHHVLYDKSCFEKLLLDLSINVTDMFRDPLFYQAIRDQVIPDLKKLPFIKVWHAGAHRVKKSIQWPSFFSKKGFNRRRGCMQRILMKKF